MLSTVPSVCILSPSLVTLKGPTCCFFLSHILSLGVKPKPLYCKILFFGILSISFSICLYKGGSRLFPDKKKKYCKYFIFCPFDLQHLRCHIFFFFFNFLSKYQFGSDLTFSALRKKTTKKAWLYFFFNFLLLFEHLPNLISILKFKQLKSFSSPKYSLPSQQDSDDNFPLTTTNKSFSYK